MLGHHYFMLRDFSTALSHYQEVLKGGGASTEVRKRALICYVQSGRIAQAIPLFEGLITEDLECIVKHNVDRYGCPCPEIIDQYECSRVTTDVAQGDRIALGMLWLFCDVRRSHQWFAEALREDSSSAFLRFVTGLLITRIATAPRTPHHIVKKERRDET